MCEHVYICSYLRQNLRKGLASTLLVMSCFFYCNGWEQDFPTSDVFPELIVRLLQRFDQLWDAALLDQGDLVVHVLVDEVPSGPGGKALHFLAFAVEQLHQLPDALQLTHLQTGWKEKGSAQDSCISHVNFMFITFFLTKEE